MGIDSLRFRSGVRQLKELQETDEIAIRAIPFRQWKGNASGPLHRGWAHPSINAVAPY
jgi:hypothetical protein